MTKLRRRSVVSRYTELGSVGIPSQTSIPNPLLVDTIFRFVTTTHPGGVIDERSREAKARRSLGEVFADFPRSLPCP